MILGVFIKKPKLSDILLDKIHLSSEKKLQHGIISTILTLIVQSPLDF